MDKAERRRRRRRFDQETGADEPATTAADSAQAVPGEIADTAPAVASEEQPSAAAVPEELSAAAVSAPERSEPSVPPEQPPVPRPAAMAEVIGSGFPKTTRTPTAEKSAAPDVDPFF